MLPQQREQRPAVRRQLEVAQLQPLQRLLEQQKEPLVVQRCHVSLRVPVARTRLQRPVEELVARQPENPIDFLVQHFQVACTAAAEAASPRVEPQAH